MRFNIPSVTKNLIIINALIWIMAELKPGFMIPTFALFFPESPFFEPWQIITHMFMHGGFFHLFFNMYTLLIFGSVLERVWGPKKFTFFYFVTGLGAALLHTGVQYIDFAYILPSSAIPSLLGTPTVGASGAIYGLLLGYAMLYPDSELTLVFPPITLKAKWFVIIFALIELTFGLTGTQLGVAHFAHLGGMLFGWLIILYWKKKRKLYDYR